MPKIPDFDLPQSAAVLSAFAAVGAGLPDALAQFGPFRPHVVGDASNAASRQLMAELTRQLETAARRAAELLDRAGERGRTTFVGEFLQFGTLPCF